MPSEDLNPELSAPAEAESEEQNEPVRNQPNSNEEENVKSKTTVASPKQSEGVVSNPEKNEESRTENLNEDVKSKTTVASGRQSEGVVSSSEKNEEIRGENLKEDVKSKTTVVSHKQSEGVVSNPEKNEETRSENLNEDVKSKTTVASVRKSGGVISSSEKNEEIRDENLKEDVKSKTTVTLDMQSGAVASYFEKNEENRSENLNDEAKNAVEVEVNSEQQTQEEEKRVSIESKDQREPKATNEEKSTISKDDKLKAQAEQENKSEQLGDEQTSVKTLHFEKLSQIISETASDVGKKSLAGEETSIVESAPSVKSEDLVVSKDDEPGSVTTKSDDAKSTQRDTFSLIEDHLEMLLRGEEVQDISEQDDLLAMFEMLEDDEKKPEREAEREPEKEPEKKKKKSKRTAKKKVPSTSEAAHDEIKSGDTATLHSSQTGQSTVSEADTEGSSKAEPEAEKFDRKMYYDAYAIYMNRYQLERARNNFLHTKMADYYRKRKMYHVMLKRSSLPMDADKIYEKQLEELENLNDLSTREQLRINSELDYLKTKCTQRHLEVQALFGKLQQTELDLAKEFMSNDTGHAEKAFEKYLRRQKSQLAALIKIRLEYIKMRNRVVEKQEALNAIDNLGPNFRLIDYAQLKVDNRNLQDKLDEKDLELSKIRRKCHNSIQILAHWREKAVALDYNIVNLNETLETLTYDFDDAREQLAYVKSEKDEWRSGIHQMKEQSGLLTKPKLLRDMENSLTEVKQKTMALDSYKRECKFIDDLVGSMRKASGRLSPLK